MINSKYISSVYNNAFTKQLLWFSIGYIIIIIISNIKINKIFKISKPFYYISIFLLILVLIIGRDINGAKCWLNFGFISFQPSELVKISLPLVLINTLNDKGKYKLIKIIIYTFIPSILVFLEPDTGAVISYIIIFLIIIINAKLNKWFYIAITSLSIIILLTFFITYFYNRDLLINIMGSSIFYRMDRLINYTTGNSYQLDNALITIGSASIFGNGLNNVSLYIPEAPTDFIFAFSIGNFGITSGLLIIISLFLLDIIIIYNIYSIKDNKYKLLVSIYTSIIIFQQIYNLLMNVGIVPIMGIPIPLLSYGGTNTIIVYIFLGIILNIINQNKKLPK